jgi:plasmid stability protein
MATMLIRDIPDELHAEIVSEAQRNLRSAEKQALMFIKLGLRKRISEEELETRAEKVRQVCKRPVTMAEILEATEEDH